MKYLLKRLGKIMKKNNFAGWKDIFSFAFVQTLKSKSFRVSIIMLCVMMIAMPIVYSVLYSGVNSLADESRYDTYMEDSLGTMEEASTPESEFISEYDDIYVGIHMNEEGEDVAEKSLNMSVYMLQLGFVIILIFIISFSGESIATSVVTEKAGRMVEYLMITVKPMAIFAGKIIAVFLTTLIELFSMIVSIVISSFICNTLFGQNFFASFSTAEMSFNPLVVLMILLFFIGSFLFFAMIAGIAGATVSRIEELSEGILLFTLTMIVGAYMSIALAMNQLFDGASGYSTYAIICYLLPISSPFCVPQSLIFGRISYLFAAGSLLILFVSVVLLFVFVSKIYEYMLFYYGTRLKLKDIIRIARYGRKEGRLQ